MLLVTAAWARGGSSGGKRWEQTLHHATAMRGCTQEDAPALEIYLTRTPLTRPAEPPPPYIRIEISSSPSETIPPVSLTLIQMRRDPARRARIVRAELVEAGHESVWLSGTIRLNEVAPERDVSGHYDFTTPAGRFEGGFVAKYLKRTALCG